MTGHADAPFLATLEAQRETIDFLTATLRRMTHAMTVQSDAAFAAVQGLAAAAHALKGRADQLEADKVALQAQVASLSATAEDPAAMQAIVDAANAATAEIAPPVADPAAE